MITTSGTYCLCRHPICHLDNLLRCKVEWVCDMHDNYMITGRMLPIV